MNDPKTRPALETIAQMFLANLLSWAVVGVLGSLVAHAYYTDLEGIDPGDTSAERVMATRPDAPGSDHALWAQHEEKCWRYEAEGPATGAILRIRPNDPFVYTTKPRLVDRAIDQAVNKHDRGLDRVLAFCTDK